METSTRIPCTSCKRQAENDEEVQDEDEASCNLPIQTVAAVTRQQNQEAPQTLRPNQGWLDGWDLDQFRLEQLEYESIGPFLVGIEAQVVKREWRTISDRSSRYKALWTQWECLKVKSGLLFRKIPGITTNSDKWQLVVPQTKRMDVFEHLPEHSTGGHLGMDRTLKKIQLAFFWPKMIEDITLLCHQCDRCAARKPSRGQHKAPLQQYLVGEPLERIAIDILGPLPRTCQGNKFILVIGDYFTKWAEAIPLPDQEAETVAHAVVHEFICGFGTPRQLHSDRGSNCESHLFQEVCSLLDIDKTRTTSRRPQSDGMVERFNRTLETMLTMYAEHKQDTWDQHLQNIMLAYRSSVHDSTGFTPNRMMLGREVELPFQAVVGCPSRDQQTAVEYVNNL